MPRKSPQKTLEKHLSFQMVRKTVSELTPAPYNPRVMSSESKTALRESVLAFGLVEPIVWNRQTGHVVGGHQRLDVLVEAGVESVEVIEVSLAEEREKALNIALNHRSLQGDWDLDKLTPLLEEIHDLPEFAPLKFDELEKIAITDFPEDEVEKKQLDLPEKFNILVECENEAQQVELLEKFGTEGLKCRALIRKSLRF